jgi:hypothetical protein
LHQKVATGRDRLLGKLEPKSATPQARQRLNVVYGLTVSPDGKTILYTKLENLGSDLMMIENFR